LFYNKNWCDWRLVCFVRIGHAAFFRGVAGNYRGAKEAKIERLGFCELGLDVFKNILIRAENNYSRMLP